MLVKSLSRKSNLLQIGLSVLFLILFFLRIWPLNLDWQSVLGISALLLSLVVGYLFLNHSNLASAPGLSFFYYLVWFIAFSDIALDYKLSIALLCSTLIFWRLMIVEKNPENKKFLFDVGLLLSVAAFCFPPIIFLIGFLLIAYFYKQNVNFRGFLLFIIGLLLPILLGIQVIYILGKIDFLSTYQDSIQLNFLKTPLWGLIPIGILLFMSFFDHVSNLMKQDINKRHNYFICFLYFLNCLVVVLLFGGKNTEVLMFLGLPVSIFISRLTYYQPTKTRKEIIAWLFVVGVAGFYFRNEIAEIYLDLLGNVAF